MHLRVIQNIIDFVKNKKYKVTIQRYEGSDNAKS